MPRRIRHQLPGLALHVIQRGNDRAPCFLDDRDRLIYLAQLEMVARHSACMVHAYVLMTNHVHLLVTPQADHAASVMMQRLGRRYVHYFNRKHGRTGTLWEGRFRSSVVQRDSYLFACYRYIELNPVRAEMVARPADYPWSSYRTNAEGLASSLIVPHGEWVALGSTAEQRLAAYRAMFENPIDGTTIEAIREAARGNAPVGSRLLDAHVQPSL